MFPDRQSQTHLVSSFIKVNLFCEIPASHDSKLIVGGLFMLLILLSILLCMVVISEYILLGKM